jgi:hypothetical protein
MKILVISTFVKVLKLVLLPVWVKVPILVLLPRVPIAGILTDFVIDTDTAVLETSIIGISTDTKIPTMFLCPPQYRYRNTG